MEEEIIIVEDLKDNYDETTVTDIEVVAEQNETIEYIKAEEIEPIEVEITEQVGWTTIGDGNVTHDSLIDRNEPGQHLMSAITGLEEALHTLSSISTNNTKYSTHTGVAEFRQWSNNYKNGRYKDSGGVGFFVSLTREQGNTEGGNIRIDLCNGDTTDVYGVTVANSGFCGNQSAQYDLLYPETAGVIDTPTSEDLSDNPNYAKVCLLGGVQVRTVANSNIQIGDYVVPSANGFAKKSENNVGFKVINVGTKYFGDGTYAWSYVEIALVPQNDNVSRVLKELEGSQVNLNNVVLQLGNSVSDMGVNVGTLSGKVDGFQDIIDESKVTITTQNQAIQEVQTKVTDINTKAETAMNTATTLYTAAVSQAQETAKESVKDVLSDVGELQANMEVIARWSEDYSNPNADQRIAGFVARANEDNVALASLTKAFTENGTDLAAIIQKIDENGAAIQHLVTHVDKYILGENSPADGLTLEETSIIQSGTIYVPTVEHNEIYTIDDESSITFTFEYGKSYIWKAVENQDYYMWEVQQDETSEQSVVVFTNASEAPTGYKDGDLWYCWQGVTEDGNYSYNPGTLYCWNGAQKIWVPVASANDGKSTLISLLNQTAQKFTSVYVDIQGNTSSIEQTAEHIDTVVEDFDGQISNIHQTAEDIMMGVYDPKQGSTSLGLLLDGITSTSINAEPWLVKTVMTETLPTGIVRYADAPMWNGTEFVFGGEPLEDGEEAENECWYYINKEGKTDKTFYCQTINGGYEVYRINNVAMASLNTRVTNTESEVESWTRFQKGQDETVTSMAQLSDGKNASISSMVYGDFRDCTEIKLELTDEEKNSISSRAKYAKQPTYDLTTKKFSFEGIAEGSDYCIGSDDNISYYKLLYDSNDMLIGYERYEMKSSPYATIFQEINEDGTSAGLVTSSGTSAASIVAKTINNGASEIFIDADKINVDGSTEFSSGLGGTTTISGDLVRTGVIKSANYNGPTTYTMYGAKIDTDNNIIITSDTLSDCVKYAIALEGIEYKLLSASEDQSYYKANGIKAVSYLQDSIPSNPAKNDVWYNTATETVYVYDGSIWAEGNYKLTGGIDSSVSEDESCYIVSDADFDLVEQGNGKDVVVEGTKFDLNNGTIYSKNLILNREGDLTVYGNGTFAGRITATSGYIGNGMDGFTIDWANATLTHTVDENGLEAGDYYFRYDGVYYMFSVSNDLVDGDTIVLNCNNLKVSIDDVSVDVEVSESIPYEAVQLTSELTNGNHYYLSNGQLTYNGDDVTLGTAGVYVGPDGIGLGNGNFYVDNSGDVTTQGTFTMRSSDSNIFVVDANGNLTMGGNITLGGDITFLADGIISWDRIDNLEGTTSTAYNTALEASSNIHDLAVGAYVPDVSDGEITFISETHIYAPDITGGTIVGGKFYATGVSTDGVSSESAYYIYNGAYSTGMQVGYIGYDQTIGSSNEAANRVFFGTSNGTALKIQSSGNMSLSAGSHCSVSDGIKKYTGTIYFMSDVEFAGNVKGLKITFG